LDQFISLKDMFFIFDSEMTFIHQCSN